MAQPGRSFLSSTYRFGFNGKENEQGWGNQTTQDYGFRFYNANIARFLSVDPLAAEYPWYTPYQFAGNMPIWATDLDGLEENIKYYHYGLNSQNQVITLANTGTHTRESDGSFNSAVQEYANNKKYGTEGAKRGTLYVFDMANDMSFNFQGITINFKANVPFTIFARDYVELFLDIADGYKGPKDGFYIYGSGAGPSSLDYSQPMRDGGKYKEIENFLVLTGGGGAN